MLVFSQDSSYVSAKNIQVSQNNMDRHKFLVALLHVHVNLTLMTDESRIAIQKISAPCHMSRTLVAQSVMMQVVNPGFASSKPSSAIILSDV